MLQNLAKSLGYSNAVAGRFVRTEIVDPPIDSLALAALMGVPGARPRPRGDRRRIDIDIL